MRLRNLIPEKTVVLPHLKYCYLAWHFCRASRRKMERLQERALRAVFNTKMHTYEQLLTKANLPSLYNRRWQDIAILVFKVKNNLVPRYAFKTYSLIMPQLEHKI